MNVASLQDIKSEIQELSEKQLMELCILLAKYKKDNKEYLNYLLFQSHNREGYILNVKAETDQYFEEIKSIKNLYYIKKSLRKVLRILNKYCRYIGDKASTTEILLYFCQKIKQSSIPLDQSIALEKILASQVKKIKTLSATLHEDLQADYLRELEDITGII